MKAICIITYKRLRPEHHHSSYFVPFLSGLSLEVPFPVNPSSTHGTSGRGRRKPRNTQRRRNAESPLWLWEGGRELENEKGTAAREQLPRCCCFTCLCEMPLGRRRGDFSILSWKKRLRSVATFSSSLGSGGGEQSLSQSDKTFFSLLAKSSHFSRNLGPERKRSL